MTRERWSEVKLLLDRALDLPAPERHRFAEEQCKGDRALLAELESYLDLDSEVDELFESPILDLIAGRPPEYRAGQQIGPYRLEGEIARGGMGVVYRAERIEGGFKQTVAIKVLKRGFDTGDFVRRFRTEQQILAGLAHPNIVRLFDGGATEDGLPYLVMEPVEGTRLDHYCTQERPDLDQRLDLFLKICDAVHVAHQHMVVHCDLKPSNVLVTAEGEPKLLDFGIAKVLRQGQDDAVSHSISLRLGTPPYASPEQVAGQTVTTGNDVYSLGCLLFLLLTGKAPMQHPGADHLPRVPSRVLEAEALANGKSPFPVRPEQLRGDLDAIALKARSWSPAERYASAAALAEDIRRHRAQLPVEAQPLTWRYQLSRFARRRRRELAVAAAFLVLLLVGGTATAVTQYRAGIQQSRADTMRSALLRLTEAVDPTSASSAGATAVEVVDRIITGGSFGYDEDRATIYDRMGRLLVRLDHMERARPLLERGLAIREGNPDTTPEDLGASLNNLGHVLMRQHETDRACELFERAEVLFDASPNTEPEELFDLRANLATCRERQGTWDEAEALYRSVIAGRTRLYGEDAPELVKTLNSLGGLLLKRHRLDEAEPLLRQTLRIREQQYGPGSSATATALMNLGLLYDSKGEHDQAVATYRRALGIRRQINGIENPASARAESSLAYALLGRRERGDLEEAANLLSDALRTLRTENGPTDDDTLTAQRNLAAALLAQGQAAEAEDLLRFVVSNSEDRLPWRLADAESLLGATLLAQGKIDEARPLLEGAAEVIAEDRGAESRPAREARERWERWLALADQ